MNPMLEVATEDLFARIREHTDGACDDEIAELERRLIVILLRFHQMREKLEAAA